MKQLAIFDIDGTLMRTAQLDAALIAVTPASPR